MLDVTTTKLSGVVETYTADRIHERSRLIALGVDARRQRYPDEQPFVYRPLAGQEDKNRWSEAARADMLADYNARDIFI